MPPTPQTSATPATLQALHAALQPGLPQATRPRLMVAGATGALGGEMLRRLAGSGQFSHTEVLAREPMGTGLPSVSIVQVTAEAPDRWAAPPAAAHTGVIMFEPPRLYYDRERALWTPQPEQLPALARWFHRCGVRTLVVVVPHARGRLPDAVKRGLANLDEQDVAALGFERVLFVRSAQKIKAAAPQGFLQATAAWMLSSLNYMVPASEQPVRPVKLAEFIDAALRVLPEGTHVASPELLWRAGQGPASGSGGGDMHQLVQAWLNTRLQG